MKMRWRIACLVSVAIAISYLDRQTLPVAIKAIEQDIPVTNQQFSLLQTAFLVTYALIDLFWLPKYLYNARDFDIKAVGTFAWIPPAAAGIGCLAGGWFSSWLLHRQLPLNRA